MATTVFLEVPSPHAAVSLFFKVDGKAKVPAVRRAIQERVTWPVSFADDSIVFTHTPVLGAEELRL